MTRFGAIYFPICAGQLPGISNAQWYFNNALMPHQYQTRAPWFAQALSAETNYINMTQANMDQDCIYAANGGIKFWVFGWYGNAGEAGDGTGSLQTEFKLYQASPNKNLVNWCLDIGYEQFQGYVNTDLTKLINYVKQPNYEKVLGNRPLIFFIFGHTIPAGMAATVTTFRNACAAAGIGDPYIVQMEFTPDLASNHAGLVGADAISSYCFPPAASYRLPFATFSTNLQNGWPSWLGYGRDVVLNLTSGWNLTPNHSRGYPGDSYNRGGIEALLYDHIVPATPAELAAYATNAKAFMAAHSASYPANIAIWYAWSEHTEGGYIRPLWSATGPNKTRLDALASVHNS